MMVLRVGHYDNNRSIDMYTVCHKTSTFLFFE